MSPETAFHCEVEKSRDEALGVDVTTIHCHGRLTNENAGKIKDLVKPMIGQGGHIIIDLGDLSYLDSSGLGALVGLKVSALNKGLCRLELANLTPRVKELLSLSNLTKLFAS
ncbi:MAG TPA: STAS domain-containing protein [Silvibacterium sp.]|jgi:anti-sigma B factor antagonist|nr:STAS domain-containing protein [Silvibacterium sp.]